MMSGQPEHSEGCYKQSLGCVCGLDDADAASKKTRRKTTSRTPKRIIHARLRGDAHKDGTYDVLLEDHAGVCGICRRPPNGKRLDIDHDHRTLQIRGLLCRGCNMRLRRGMTPEWLRAAADYLERSSRDTRTR